MKYSESSEISGLLTTIKFCIAAMEGLSWNNDTQCPYSDRRMTCIVSPPLGHFLKSSFELIPINWTLATGNFVLTNTFYRVIRITFTTWNFMSVLVLATIG